MTAAEIAALARARSYRDGWRGFCPVHGGRSGTSFSIREGEGGRVILKCWAGCQTVDILCALGLHWSDLFNDPHEQASRSERERQQQNAERAERISLEVWDQVQERRVYCRDLLHRVENLQRQIGEQIICTRSEAERVRGWGKLARLAPVATYFLEAFNLAFHNDPAVSTRFALASPTERRAMIFGGPHAAYPAAA